MNKKDIIDAISLLGESLSNLQETDDLLYRAEYQNQWFTLKNQHFALQNWANSLTQSELEAFAQPYSFSSMPKQVGIIMAGNVPLVGLHDLLCVLLSGHIALVKLSKDDELLTKFIIETLCKINKDFIDSIKIVDRLNNVDAAIATGSNNSSRYFEYYFRDIPHIIRKNRTSVAIIDHTTTDDELKLLAADVFRYFGLGCRNVGKLFLPKGYAIPKILDQWESWSHLADHNKYINNYTYHKALFLMNLEPHFDNGFILLKESSDLFSPLGCLFYEYYEDTEMLQARIEAHRDQIQVCIGSDKVIEKALAFGTAQNAGLLDFADGIDTLSFLESI